jgi:rhodanese-related sulfurtransferase
VVQEIDSVELERRLQAGEVLLLDIRTDGEVARGILPAAQHLPMQQIPMRTAQYAANNLRMRRMRPIISA